MALIQSKQISKLIAGKMYVNDFAMASITGTLSGVGVTDTLQTASLTAADNGDAVLMQPHYNGPVIQEGFITSGRNLVELYDAEGMKYTDTGANEVYGRLTLIAESAAFIGFQSANYDLRNNMQPGAGNYATKADYVTEIQDLINAYNIAVPLAGGRTAEQTAYADELDNARALATTMELSGAFTTTSMFTILTNRYESQSQFNQEKGLAASEVLTTLGDDPTTFASKLAMVTALNTLVTDYNTAFPAISRTTSQTVHFWELSRLAFNASNLEANPAKTVATMHADLVADAAAQAAYADGAYTVMFFVNAAGVETAYSFPAQVDPFTLKMVIPYLYTFEHLPFDFATGLKSVYVNDDPAGGSTASIQVEQVTVTAANTVDALAFEYKTGTRSTVFINGQVALSATAQYAIDPGTNKIVWNAATAGFSLMPTDEVFIEYETTGAAFP